MSPKNLLIFTCACVTIQLHAQKAATTSGGTISLNGNEVSGTENPRNFIKINLTGIVLKNYAFQYERVLNKSISVALSFRTMPSTAIPFRDAILRSLGDDEPDTRTALENVKISNIAFTPELRFYVGKKGYGRGFYIAPFYRYARFTTNNLVFDYGTNGNANERITLSGDLTANTGGILFGAQWALGTHMCLDWWILGPHYGQGTGNFSGVSSQPLTPNQQAELRQDLEDLDIPLTNKTVSVNANGASLKLDGPWGGVRAGISIGVRF